MDVDLHESSVSHQAAQNEVDRLQAVIARKRRYFKELRQDLEHSLRAADGTIAANTAEITYLREPVET